MENNDIIVQVDERTKKLMKDIQEGLSTNVKGQISQMVQLLVHTVYI